MITSLNKHGYIALGVIIALGRITGPFLALLLKKSYRKGKAWINFKTL